jgi:CO/xanthine dehydrogenase Mo-binding subunit
VLALPAHALIERIDATEALAIPGVVAVLTAADLPIVLEGTDRIHPPLARREILWAGQPPTLARDRTLSLPRSFRPLTGTKAIPWLS